MSTDSGAFSGAFLKCPSLSDRFEILNVLGDGAAGFVYRVRDKQRNNQEVALKVLANDLAFDDATFQRFMAELKICQTIRHPNVVEAYDLIELGDTVAYTMEYVDGGSLQSLFVERRIGYDAIDRIFEQILDAVHTLHMSSVVHRDIKLENVLVRTDGVVKLTDLGLMKKLGNKGLTRPGILLGTPQYMPPEYVRESQYDERGDIYTLGLMLYELVTGKRYLNHLKGQEVITHLIKTKFEVARASLAGVPRKYLEILAKSLDPRPAQRFQSAMEMKAAFKNVDNPPMDGKSTPLVQGGLSIQQYSKAIAYRAYDERLGRALWFRLLIGLLFGLAVASTIFLSKKYGLL